MPNRFPGTCYKCGHLCNPGEGAFEKVTRDARRKWPDLPHWVKWQVQHHECARDYDRDAHYIHNPKRPSMDAKYQLAEQEEEGRPPSLVS